MTSPQHANLVYYIVLAYTSKKFWLRNLHHTQTQNDRTTKLCDLDYTFRTYITPKWQKNPLCNTILHTICLSVHQSVWFKKIYTAWEKIYTI